MRWVLIFVATFWVNVSSAGAETCANLFEILQKTAPGDLTSCEPKVAIKPFETCVPPSEQTAERPPSHVVLILDASGSMAGQLGGESKMKIAKREAQNFLTAIADDVPVGLVVYGHKGDNTKEAKAQSCAAQEWLAKVGAGQDTISKAIETLSPTGWTPLAGALDFARSELESLPSKTEEGDTSVPYVYLLSDGKETCGGDPVQAAQAFHASDVKAIVNVIGFDVDAETRDALGAISQAGGGRYLAAKDAQALREQLLSEVRSTSALAKYHNCLRQNIANVNLAYHHSKVRFVKCVRAEAGGKRRRWYEQQIKASSNEQEKACLKEVRTLARQEEAKAGRYMLAMHKEMEAQRRKKVFEITGDPMPLKQEISPHKTVAKTAPKPEDLPIEAAKTSAISGVGIQFDIMVPGTQLVTRKLGSDVLRKETFLGKEGDHFVTELKEVKPDGSERFIFKITYNSAGQLLKGERNGQTSEHSPVSCLFKLGPCEMTLIVPDSYTEANTEFSKLDLEFDNILEGDTLIERRVLSGGNFKEVRYTLGKYNLRLTRETSGFGGKKIGYSFVKLIEP